jgi:DNA polymerase
MEKLADHIAKWNSCTRCPIGKWTTNHVFYRGSSVFPLDVLFIGEAPGNVEDTLGQPFVGRTGKQVLNRLIALTQSRLRWRFKYGLVNSIVCTPFTSPDKKKIEAPNLLQIQNCSERLAEVVKLTRPHHIVLLGTVAKNAFDLMNQHTYAHTVHITKTVHPSFILRKGGESTLEFKQCLLALVKEIGYAKEIPF